MALLMAKQWTLLIVPSALQEIYRIPRGAVAEVTAAIGQLEQDPFPDNADRIALIENCYRISASGRIIEYQVLEEERQVKILQVE